MVLPPPKAVTGRRRIPTFWATPQVKQWLNGVVTVLSVLLCLLILLVAYGLVRFARGFTVAQGFRIGALWLLLTLAFEFGFGIGQNPRQLAGHLA